ncbi:hypothetical protein ACFWNQ_25845 [Streptomyces virginiae]|uniref:hypothetical protein n=1 Tax=Streptomyces virginiae TaxID=1961 RepID=UPI00365A3F8B
MPAVPRGDPYTPRDAVVRLARDTNPEVRVLDPVLWAELAADPAERVRTRARIQPLPRTREQFLALDHEMGRNGHDCGGLIVEPYEEPDLDRYRACAMSEEVILRGRPPDAPLCPPTSWHGRRRTRTRRYATGRQRGTPRSRLPRTGPAHLRRHEAPEVRALAAADPTGRSPWNR